MGTRPPMSEKNGHTHITGNNTPYVVHIYITNHKQYNYGITCGSYLFHTITKHQPGIQDNIYYVIQLSKQPLNFMQGITLDACTLQ